MEELKPDDFVVHKNELYYLISVDRRLGYGLYTIRNIMTTAIITVTRLQLEKVDLDLADEIDIEVPRADNNNPRFYMPDEEEVAKMKQERNRPNTEKQMGGEGFQRLV